LHVRADRRSDVLLQPRLGLILGILLEFVSNIPVDRRRALLSRDEIVAHDARFQGSLFAVQSGSPRVVWIRRRTEPAVLPGYRQSVIFEHGGLLVGNVRLSALENPQAAKRRNT